MADTNLNVMSDIIKDSNTDDRGQKRSSINVFDSFSDFFSNSYHSFIVRKSERLASALYVITGFMPVEEPVRTRLRVCAIDLITRSSHPSELGGAETEKFESRCAEIATILETAQYAGLISHLNAKMIGDEYGALASFVRTNAAKISERGGALKKGSIASIKALPSSIRQYDKSLLNKSHIGKGKSSKKNNNSESSRKDIIISLFSTLDKVSLKDAMSVIPDVSDKTVQRELLDLVAQGILIKEGERRWTTYKKA